MEYFLVTFLLFLSMLIYFKIADKYNIIDKPNERSAHTIPTLRGGGIIYWIAFMMIFIQTFPNNSYLFIAITLIAAVSFIDDINSLPNKIRLFIQFSSIALVFLSLNIFALFPVWLTIIAFILFVGIINAYNFMDGINGITGCYTIVVLSSLLYVNIYMINFTANNLIIYPIIASIVFLFFNFRKKAKCFAGDIGSISIAFWVLYLILKLMLATESVVWILFLAIYGADTICTIIYRLTLKENIFVAHRHHFYQMLCNDLKIDHRVVAILYAILQMKVAIFVVYFYEKLNIFLIFAVVIIPLILIYLTRFLILKKLNKRVA